MYTAGCDGSTSTMGAGSPVRNSSIVRAPSIEWPSVEITIRTADVVMDGICNHIGAAAGSMTTAVGFTEMSSFSISGAGLVGFNGETIAPIPTAARYDTTK